MKFKAFSKREIRNREIAKDIFVWIIILQAGLYGRSGSDSRAFRVCEYNAPDLIAFIRCRKVIKDKLYRGRIGSDILCR